MLTLPDAGVGAMASIFASESDVKKAGQCHACWTCLQLWSLDQALAEVQKGLPKDQVVVIAAKPSEDQLDPGL